AAVALGAKVIEKHFSLRRDLYGADHKVSMTPSEMAELVAGIREFEKNPAVAEAYLAKDIVKKGMGTAEKVLQEDEAVFRPFFRKSLMAGRALPIGTVLRADDIYAMRPQQFAGGLPSEHYEAVLGKKLSRPLKKFDPITADVFVV
ncbi:MAG: N-acetylneuraminate synthase family protein, partial [Candidatus Sungbacteria bacterium]|nr:N-acetylneuraminate synthase family protein [Candidatus Sungbacteria bacterium]